MGFVEWNRFGYRAEVMYMESFHPSDLGTATLDAAGNVRGDT